MTIRVGQEQLHAEQTKHATTTTTAASASNSTNSNSNSSITKDDLWKNAELKTLKNNASWIVEMTGMDSKTHTVYARAVPTADYIPSSHVSPTVREVVESVVDIAWKHVAKHILEAKAAIQKRKGGKEVLGLDDEEILRIDLDHWNQGAFPPADQLLELGAVWLVNETSFLSQVGKKKKHPHTKKKRLSKKEDGDRQPDWNDYVLRVHYAPNRFHAMEEVDWSKYCRGLLLGDDSVQVILKGKQLAAHEHVPLSGYPDKKDGVIVYEDAEHGFAILNKPGTVPDHATVNNHAEDVLSAFSQVLREREKKSKEEQGIILHHHHHKAAHVSLPLPLDTETQGLVIIATKRLFGSYLVNLVEGKHHAITKKYKCLVCIKSPEAMLGLNDLQESRRIVQHFYHHNPTHKHHTNFVTDIPKNHNAHEYGRCQLRIAHIGTNHGLYAANVTSDTSIGDAHLAQRIWGLGVQNHSKTPAEDLGISYVAQLELEQIVDAEQLHLHLNTASRLTPQQLICGQMAALGFPLVGDSVHGGGTSEVWGHRHGWNRLALQCCEWSFPEPYWSEPVSSVAKSDEKVDANSIESADSNEKEKDSDWNVVTKAKQKELKKATSKDSGSTAEGHHQNGTRQLLASAANRCAFRLNEAWWNPLLDEYHVEGFPEMASEIHQ